ncbi:retrotransposon protein, putative, ty1-copia subclass [Tanacetum coccineum]
MLAELRKCIEKPPAVEIYDLELPSLYRRVAANKTKSEPGAAVQEFKKKELSYGDQYLQVGQWKPSSCLKHKCFELDFTFGLAHIGKTRMQKLHREGLLENIDEESFDKCESCISGKMTKKPFNKNIERATDLLVVMDMFIYLNIKHEVFETFKVFKAEVELQLGKKIKALRSDRGGEYLSQEFKDYLSENGIVQNLTSPYTPQQNGVSERRNRTLLDMVRSMFNLTTLPLSFWDYALRNLCRSLKYDLLEKEIFISQEFSGRDYDLEDDHMDTLPSKNTSEILGDLGEPANYKTAMLDPDKVIWQGAMDEEMNSMKVNEVWTEVDPPPNAKIVRNVSLSDIRAIRILIAIAAYYDYEIWQMDVKTAFLNGRLDEDIYMEQPEGYVNPKYPNRLKQMAPNPNTIHPSSSFHQAVKTKGFLQLRGTEVYSRAPKHNGKVNSVKSRAIISHSNNEAHVSLKKAHMDVGFALISLRKETQVSLKRIASLAIRVRSLSDLTAQNVDPMIG